MGVSGQLLSYPGHFQKFKNWVQTLAKTKANRYLTHFKLSALQNKKVCTVISVSFMNTEANKGKVC